MIKAIAREYQKGLYRQKAEAARKPVACARITELKANVQ
jgi:hypothetical protein